MSLSDEILARPGDFRALRDILCRLGRELDARSVFLIDEGGVPFAATGNVEFDYPHPLSALAAEASGTPILEALLGQPQAGASDVLSYRVSPRALMAIILDHPIGGWKRWRAIARVKRAANQLRPRLEGSASIEL